MGNSGVQRLIGQLPDSEKKTFTRFQINLGEYCQVFKFFIIKMEGNTNVILALLTTYKYILTNSSTILLLGKSDPSQNSYE
jgi:hypothetical protein